MDLARRLTVTLAEIFCIVGTLVGTGVIGTRVAESSGGALSADATLLAPAGTAFSIWSVIYAGLAAYTVWQWLPGNATDERARATGWLAAASMVLNATWLLVTQTGWIWVSVVVILALLATLVALIARLSRLPARGLVDRLVVDGTFGLYLGWVAVATCANTAAALAVDVSVDRAVAEVGAVVAVVLVLLGGAWLAMRYGGRWAVAIASTWGLVWIAVGRLGDSPESVVTAVAALVGAVAMILLVARQRGPTLTA